LEGAEVPADDVEKGVGVVHPALVDGDVATLADNDEVVVQEVDLEGAVHRRLLLRLTVGHLVLCAQDVARTRDGPVHVDTSIFHQFLPFVKGVVQEPAGKESFDAFNGCLRGLAVLEGRMLCLPRVISSLLPWWEGGGVCSLLLIGWDTSRV